MQKNMTAGLSDRWPVAQRRPGICVQHVTVTRLLRRAIIRHGRLGGGHQCGPVIAFGVHLSDPVGCHFFAQRYDPRRFCR